MIAGTNEALVAFGLATTWVTAAAFAVPGIVGRAARSSRIVIATVAWNAMIIAPIYGLGLTDRLYGGVLAATVGLVASLVLAIGFVRLGPRELVREIGATARTFVRLPWDALSEASRAGSFVAFGVCAAVFLWLWATAQAVLGPTWGDWDCLWYHEPMIGFSIQNHGFAQVPLEPFSQKINGYPRLTEMTMLWFGIFHGRWAIDLVNPLFMPLIAAGAYVLVRELGSDRVRAIGWAVVFVTLPGIVRIVSTTMVDLHGFALALAAVAYGTRRTLRLSDAWIATLAITMAMGSKIVLMVPGGLLCLLLVARLVHGRVWLGRGRVALTILVGGGLVLSILAFTFVRNYLHYHNPIWPDFAVEKPEWGIHWPGNIQGMDDPRMAPADRIPHGFEDQIKRFYARPFSVNDGHSWQIIDFGVGVPWSLLPLGVLALLATVLELMLALARRFRGDDAAIARRWMALRLLFVVGPSLWLIPNAHIARYHYVSLAIVAALLVHVCTRLRLGRFEEGVVVVMIIGNLMTLGWNDRGWLRGPPTVAKWLELSPPERYHHEELGSPDRLAASLARERELGPGDVVTFERIAFTALLWNDHYSNRVVWLEDFRDPILRSRQLHATWVYAGRGGWFDEHVRLPNSGFTFVGVLEAEGFGNVYRLEHGR